MCAIFRPRPKIRAIKCGIAIFCCAAASFATPSDVLRNLGAIGDIYSFRLSLDDVDQVTDSAFSASNAVPPARLSSISGGSIFGSGASMPNDRLAIRVGKVDQRAPNDVYAHIHVRDIENNLWWAVPG